MSDSTEVDSELEPDFFVDRSSISLNTAAEYNIINAAGPAVEIGDAVYDSPELREMAVKDVEEAIDTLFGEDTFQDIIDNCPTNTPLAYNDIDYLTRHLPTATLQKVQNLANHTPFEEELILLLAYVNSQNSLIGHSDDTLEYYLQQRDDLSRDIVREDSLTQSLERQFFSLLLLASALLEELSIEIVQNEVFREEARLGCTEDQVKEMGHAQRLNLLSDIQMLSGGAKGHFKHIKDIRNNLAHDIRKRTALEGINSQDEIVEKIETMDRCVSIFLSLSGKSIVKPVSKNSPERYIKNLQTEAVKDTFETWKREKENKSKLLSKVSYIDVEQLLWEVGSKSGGRFDICYGVDFSQHDDEEIDDLLMEFINEAESAFFDRIDANANESNLDRFDFAVMLLLCGGCGYSRTADLLDTQEKYIQRKENVLAWRASSFEKELVKDIPGPVDAIWPEESSTDSLEQQIELSLPKETFDTLTERADEDNNSVEQVIYDLIDQG